ncbi:MAG: transglycosylase SLT domain-containing protein [Lachnospiraceae bacterium]|nr:transglycosylase SLT domain-containing protein [Lachnospiraceae bacterium]
MKYERKIYLIGILIMLPVVAMILAVLFPSPAAAETEPAQRTQRVENVETVMEGTSEQKKEEETEKEAGRGAAVGTVHGVSGDISGEDEGDRSISEFSGVDREDTAGDTADAGNNVGSYEQTSGDNSGDDEQAGSTESAERDGSEAECTYYTVSGFELSRDLQQYLYNRLSEFGCEWFFRYALCQIFQESQFNAAAENPNGLDKGLCQFRITYFPSVAQEAGLVEYDIFNPIDSLYVYTYMMCKYLNETGGDVAMSLSLYHSGYGGPYSAQYVSDVTRWFETVQKEE